MNTTGTAEFTHQNTRKVVLSVVFGMLCFFLSPYGIQITWDTFIIIFPWAIVFPIVISMVYGWRYAIIAGLSGGALFPFYLWAYNGYPNLFTAIIYLSFYIMLGLAFTQRVFQQIKNTVLRVIVVYVLCVIIFKLYYTYVFNFLLSLNPPFWINNTISHFSPEILNGIFIKDSLNFLAFIIISYTLIQIQSIRKLLRISLLPEMKNNGTILFLSVLVALFVWISYVLLGNSLLQNENALTYEHITLALFVITTSGTLVAKLIMNYSEAQIKINRELTAAKEQAEESAKALTHSHHLMQYIIEHNRGAIAVHDKNYKYVFVSSGYLNDYKITEKDIIGKHHYEVLPDIPQKWRDVHKRALAGEFLGAEEDSYPREDGTLEWTRWHCIPWYEADNSVGGFIIYTEIITQRKNMELELKAAKERAEESDRLKTAFLQNMSHEIRTPLNAISGFSGILNKPDLSEEKRKNFISIIQNSSNQLISIVTDILTISSLETKQEKTTISKVCINSIIVELLAIFKQQAQNRNISIYAKQQLNDKQSEIYTDKTKITQILTNLLTNALKFTHEGFVEFGYEYVVETSHGVSLQHPELKFYVKDTGIGIKPEFHDKIFERFRQANKSINKLYGGTGLGLAISKAFVELLGGKIWVQSELEKGSTFYFTIPYKPVHEIDKTTSATKQNENFKTMIVAEDEEYNFLFIEEVLIDLDVKLIHAKDGRETVEIFKANNTIDLILMDIKMPIMTGQEAAKIIKSIKPEIPIVAQSAYALEHERAKYEGIFDDYLTKPINENNLIQIVKKYFEI